VGSALSPLIAGIIAIVSLKLPYFVFSIVVFTFLIVHLNFKNKIRFEEKPDR